jgi:membrane-associated phospholipid phosphatase
VKAAESENLWARFGDVGRATLDTAALLLPLRERRWNGSFDAATSLLLATSVSKGLKAFVSERRPDGEDMDSFPSQHAAECAASGMALRRHFGTWTGDAAMGLAAIVALSRLFAKKHHPQDVIAGLCIGVAATLAVDMLERTVR